MILSEKRKKLFWTRVIKTDTCWLWTGRLNEHGYGECSVNNKNKVVHRVSLVIVGVEIPEGMMVDHKCRIRNCLNPEHLRVVTPKINALENSESVTAKNARKTHCLKNHPFDQKNTKFKGHHRICRKCKNVSRSRKRKLMTKEERDRDRGKIRRRENGRSATKDRMEQSSESLG